METTNDEKSSTNEVADATAKPSEEPSQVEAKSKRALKREKKRAEWLANRTERRVKEKEKRKLKRERKTRENDYELSYSASRKRLKEVTMASSACRVGVVVDMSFDHLMHQRDLGKCCKQLLHCYSINRRLADPMQFYITGIKEKSKGEAEMSKHEGYKNWDAHFHSEDFDAVLPKDRVVYLSSESDNVLSELEPEKYYVIGGLVDHNAHKGLTHKLAVDKGVAHARLPIDEFIKMKTRKVLTIDHVFSILASVTAGKSWRDSFLKVLPERKGIEAKICQDENADEADTCDKAEAEKCLEPT